MLLHAAVGFEYRSGVNLLANYSPIPGCQAMLQSSTPCAAVPPWHNDVGFSTALGHTGVVAYITTAEAVSGVCLDCDETLGRIHEDLKN